MIGEPLAGIRVVELSHMVMGPSCGLVLADLGADVIKLEPPDGDNTRRLAGSGAGFFAMFNRNKRSVAIDLKSPSGASFARRLIAHSDVLIENFKPGGIDALGLGYEALRDENERLIFCSLKGFLSGPYEHRVALDEVVQMMGGLAYMTGPPGRPLRAGTSVNDIMGGMFAVIGILAALEERRRTGKGQKVCSALFENNVFLVAQHMMQFAVTGKPAAPMPARTAAWAVYDVFDTADGQLFVGVVTDSQWRAFCATFGLADFAADRALATNSQRVAARDRFMPRLREMFATTSNAELVRNCEDAGLPFASITKPQDLFDDPHLATPGAMVEITLPGGKRTRAPALPLEMDGRRLGLRRDLPKIGEHGSEVAAELGYEPSDIAEMVESGVLAASPAPRG